MAISEEFREKIKNQFGDGFRYTTEVKKILKSQKKTNTNGEAYSSDHIRAIYNGKRDNQDIELAILQFFKKTKDKAKKIQTLEKSFD